MASRAVSKRNVDQRQMRKIYLNANPVTVDTEKKLKMQLPFGLVAQKSWTVQLDGLYFIPKKKNPDNNEMANDDDDDTFVTNLALLTCSFVTPQIYNQHSLPVLALINLKRRRVVSDENRFGVEVPVGIHNNIYFQLINAETLEAMQIDDYFSQIFLILSVYNNRK